MRYRALVAVMTSMLWQANQAGEFDGRNLDWQEYTSQSENIASGDGWLYVFHAEDAARVEREWAAARESIQNFETSGRLWHAASQAYREVELRAVPLLNERGQVREWIGQMTDVEEFRRQELVMRRTERLVSVGTLAAGIAHEVNNPLGAAQLSTQAAIGNLRNHPERVPECLDNVASALDRCVTIMDNILRFVRAGTSGTNQLKSQPLDQIVEHTVSMTRNYATKHDATITTSYATQPAACALVNAVEIEQVLFNLIRNAVHASEGHVTIDLETRSTIDGALIIVRDNGDGIPNEIRDRVFDPFFTTRETGSGTGLGLSIVHGIVRDHRGTIEIESSDEGTVVTIELPGS